MEPHGFQVTNGPVANVVERELSRWMERDVFRTTTEAQDGADHPPLDRRLERMMFQGGSGLTRRA